jgi:hypothetical protein
MADISLYTTRDMLDVLEQIHVPGDFLLTNFVDPVAEEHTTDTIDIDVVKHGKKMAPFVSPVREGVVITKEGMQTRTHRIPYTKMKDSITAQMALNRLPGDTIYSGRTAGDHAAREMGRILANFDQMIFRREEFMAAQALQTGKVLVSGEGVSYEIDFGMDASHLDTRTGTDAWDDDGAAIQSDLAEWADLVYDDSGLNATDAILGALAAKEMMANATFNGSLDRRLIDRGEIKIERLPLGVKYYGFDRESGLDIWGYEEEYYDEGTSTEKELIDPKKVIVLSRNLRFTRHYGAIQNIKVDFVGPRFPSNWFTDDPAEHWVMLESAPLVALHQPDGVVCATVMD